MANENPTIEVLHWTDLGPDEVHAQAYLEDEAITDARAIIADLAYGPMSERYAKAHEIYENHQARSEAWLQDRALVHRLRAEKLGMVGMHQAIYGVPVGVPDVLNDKKLKGLPWLQRHLVGLSGSGIHVKQGSLAERAGINPSLITRFKNGERYPSTKVAARLSQILAEYYGLQGAQREVFIKENLMWVAADRAASKSR